MGRLTKSKDRVKKQAEVYTPIHIVKQMIDLMSEEDDGDVYEHGKTWLEPSCGNGVFIGEIVRRKLAHCHDAQTAIEAMKDVYAVDLMPDNIQQARCQAIGQLAVWLLDNGHDLSLLSEARKVIETNIVVGNFLKPETIVIRDWKRGEDITLADCRDSTVEMAKRG